MLATAAGPRLCPREQAALGRRPQGAARRPTQAAAARRGHTASHDESHPIATVKPYLVSLAAGILVGAIYALMRVRSPAPPVVALAGLLGILIGEQGVGMARAMLAPPAAATTPATETTTHSNGKSHAP